ncbi:MAG TPA: PDZ domain-containing protein [Vicinamibacterales bacterium]|nr:PDZ domain-containing protein [Vicinamibacterales bacterium]
MRPRALGAALLLLALAPLAALAQTVSYRLSFPEAAHHVMHVEATFRSLPPGPLELRMSRSSPGRYAAHDFAKNVFDVRITDASGKALAVTRPNPHQWNVTAHGEEVRVSYKVFGDRLDGTYLAIDSSHAHINMPAAIMWARGLERTPATLRVERPADTSWRVATQLPSSGDGLTFTAPNLHYLMDSPIELGNLAMRTFTVTDEQRTPVFRLAVHHTGTDADIDGLARDVETITREARHIFREYPAFEGNTYTFIADYVPWAINDGMEHRNSTVLTSPSTIRGARLELLDTIAHEFFHAWNVERIRPKSLEPFNFEDANISGELWLAEGFNSYYAPLIMKRTGLTTLRDFVLEMGRVIDTVVTSPGRQVRSAVEMSQFAPFTDEAAAIDRTNFSNTVISYYTWGSAIALGLDLTLRDRTDGKVTLDDFMRQLWNRFGKPGAREAGYVATPYTHDDLRRTLGEVAADQAFADDFFARYVEGRDVVDYAPLVARAGLVLRSRKDRAFAGALWLQGDQAGVRILGDVPLGSPAYEAGLEREDVIVSLGNTRVSQAADVERLVVARKPGDPLPVVFERRGARVTSVIRLGPDPRVELVTAEEAGQTLTDAQRRFRAVWLNSAAGNSF